MSGCAFHALNHGEKNVVKLNLQVFTLVIVNLNNIRV